MKRREFITLLGGAAAARPSQLSLRSRRCRLLGFLARRRSDRAEARPVLSRLPPYRRQCAGFRTGRKLRNEVSVSDVDFDAVEARLARAHRGGGMGVVIVASMRAFVISSGTMVSNVIS